MLLGSCLNEFVTRPENIKSFDARRLLRDAANITTQFGDQRRDSTVSTSTVACGGGKHLYTMVYNVFGELPAWIIAWMDILLNASIVSAARYYYVQI